MLLSSLLPTSVFPLLDTTNLSLYTIPAAWLLALYPHIFAIQLYSDAAGTPSFLSSYNDQQMRNASSEKPKHDPNFEFDKVQPRSFLARLEANPDPALKPAFKAQLARAEAASLNGYENLGLYAASVVAANVALVYLSLRGSSNSLPDLDLKTLLRQVNLTSIEFILCRTLFNLFYIRGVSGGFRGAWFYGSVFCCIELAVKSGNVLRRL